MSSSSARSPPSPKMEASASVYTTFALRLYDFVVLAVSNTFAWRCRTGAVQLPFYQQHLAEGAHLEVGVGTGYYPAASARALAKTKLVTLLDLNPNTLVYSKHRLAKAGYKGEVDALEHNIFTPLPQSLRGRYDSIALFYVFHCLPGPLRKKAADVFRNVVPALAPGGVVYGTTILGEGVRHNWLGNRLLGLYNKKGIFGNREDSEEGLRDALGALFEEYEVRVVGVVALFVGRRPKPAQS